MTKKINKFRLVHYSKYCSILFMSILMGSAFGRNDNSSNDPLNLSNLPPKTEFEDIIKIASDDDPPPCNDPCANAESPDCTTRYNQGSISVAFNPTVIEKPVECINPINVDTAAEWATHVGASPSEIIYSVSYESFAGFIESENPCRCDEDWDSHSYSIQFGDLPTERTEITWSGSVDLTKPGNYTLTCKAKFLGDVGGSCPGRPGANGSGSVTITVYACEPQIANAPQGDTQTETAPEGEYLASKMYFLPYGTSHVQIDTYTHSTHYKELSHKVTGAPCQSAEITVAQELSYGASLEGAICKGIFTAGGSITWAKSNSIGYTYQASPIDPYKVVRIRLFQRRVSIDSESGILEYCNGMGGGCTTSSYSGGPYWGDTKSILPRVDYACIQEDIP